MFSNEFMRYLIKYQGEEFLNEEKNCHENKSDEITFGFHRFTQFAVVPIKVER